MKKLLCRLFGHSFVDLIDGSPYCPRCDHLPSPGTDEHQRYMDKRTAKLTFQAAEKIKGMINGHRTG